MKDTWRSTGWKYLNDACGYTAGGTSYVTLRVPQRQDYTIVLETIDLVLLGSETGWIRQKTPFSKLA